jgi:hypothetical protein
MEPEVNPLSAKDKQLLKRLITINGTGRTLLGFTRVDRMGGRYATVWEVGGTIPLYPLRRFYLFEGESSDTSGGGYQSLSRSTFRFVGGTRLDVTEIVGTYLWAWLICPAVGLLPSYWLLTMVGGPLSAIEPKVLSVIAILFCIALAVLWPVAAALAMRYLRMRYQDG